MSFNQNSGTAIWNVREKVGDIDGDRLAFQDEEIARILVDRADDKDLAAAECYRRIAGSYRRIVAILGEARPTTDLVRTIGDQFLRVADSYERRSNQYRAEAARATQEEQRAGADIDPTVTEWPLTARPERFEEYRIERGTD